MGSSTKVVAVVADAEAEGRLTHNRALLVQISARGAPYRSWIGRLRGGVDGVRKQPGTTATTTNGGGGSGGTLALDTKLNLGIGLWCLMT